MADNKKNFKCIFHIVESNRGGEVKKFWNRIGTAWVNNDGSMNLNFETFPCDGKNVQIRDYTPKEDNFGE